MEFNSGRVQTHYIHTIMKLELEKRLEESSPEEEEKEEEEEEEEEAPPPRPPSTSARSCRRRGRAAAAATAPTRPSRRGRARTRAPGPPGGAPPEEVDDDGLARILSLSAADSEDEGPAAAADPFGRSPAPSSYLDENANQSAALFHGHPPRDFPHTPSPSAEPSARSYADLSLSSDSDLEFFGSFPDYGPGPLYGSLKDYEQLDSYFHFQLPGYPGLAHAGESGTCFLESLIGLSESVPEPPATFTDNQLLEEAIQS